MENQELKPGPVREDSTPGEPLSPWAYTNPELFELEYDALFLRRWQFAGHVNDLPEAGDYLTCDIGRDSVAVLRDKDGALRAFRNVCRHRASRIFEGSGHCRGVIRCPYHGWTYRFDGSLMAVPQEEFFPDLDRSAHGLHAVDVDVFHGMIFVRVLGDGPGVADLFGHTASFFEKYGVDDYVRCAGTVDEVWNVNWKVAWDNYLENYHIPIGHPGLHRLVRESDEWEERDSGVSYGVFLVRDMPSTVEAERRYQALFPHACERVPDELKGKWVQFGLAPNLGIDLYPEMLDLFQLIPLAHDRTLVRAAFFGHADPDPAEQELRQLNLQLNGQVNDEDRQLCQRVQLGLQTCGYRPGPLSQLESSVFAFHEMLRERIPVLSLTKPPDRGTAAAINAEMQLPGSENGDRQATGIAGPPP